MPLNSKAEQLFTGFSKLTRQERYARLIEMGALSQDDIPFLDAGSPISTQLAEKFIENVIGNFSLPLGVATNFNIDGKDYIIPMAVEETSIVASASKTAKWVRNQGEIRTEIIGDNIIGQIQLAKINNFKNFEQIILNKSQILLDSVNQDITAGLVKRGGGVNGLKIREIKRPDGKSMAVIHVLANTCDAMGANLITQVCEYLKNPIEEMTGETVTMCILSNLTDTQLTKAKVIIKNCEPEIAENICEASLFANLDPYRAATHNKGILNGIDPILIATGNDWRAAEAAMHAYACQTGQYKALSDWKLVGSDLVGEFKAPIPIGIVGGMTKLHPSAQLSLRMMGIESANHLSRICAAVGLVQNLGALKALTTVGLIQGHLKLHISNLTLSAGATEQEAPILSKKLEEILQVSKRLTLTHAKEILNEIRNVASSLSKQKA